MRYTYFLPTHYTLSLKTLYKSLLTLMTRIKLFTHLIYNFWNLQLRTASWAKESNPGTTRWRKSTTSGFQTAVSYPAERASVPSKWFSTVRKPTTMALFHHYHHFQDHNHLITRCAQSLVLGWMGWREIKGAFSGPWGI